MGRFLHKFGTRLFARWPFIIALSLALLLVVGVSTLRETYSDWKVDREIQDLQSQVDGLEGRKFQISELLDRLNSADVLDREARVRLGMQKPGEKVMILQGANLNPTGDSSAPTVPDPAAVQDQRSNPQKWFAYFFIRS